MKRLLKLVVLIVLLAFVFGTGWLTAKLGIGSAVAPASLTDLERQFTQQMENAALVGYFTVAGREDRTPRSDRYDISSVRKVGDDRWQFNAKIGETGVSMPMVVPLRWIGDTPIIEMTDFTIPTVGTFSVRLLFYGDRYAGTWQHGNAGGHMYGRIEKGQASPTTP
jgi:hypothetical protein